MGTSPFACTTPLRTAQALRTMARPCRRSSTRMAAASSWATWTRMIASAASWRARRAPRWQPWTTVFRPRRSSPWRFEEVACVAKHLHEQGKAYGIDGNRLSFAGDSGGAHLSLAATMYLREELGRLRLRQMPPAVLRLVRPEGFGLPAPSGRPLGRPDRG